MRIVEKSPFHERNTGGGGSKPFLHLTALAFTLTVGISSASPVQAAVFDFELTGSRQASFRIDTQMAQSFSSTSGFGDQIQYSDVSGVFGGVSEKATIGFGTNIFATLNILADGLGFTQFAGPDLFSGPIASPNFKTGTFDLTSIVSGASTITISAATAAPEPSTWAMLMVGLAGLGFMAHRKGARRVAQTAL